MFCIVFLKIRAICFGWNTHLIYSISSQCCFKVTILKISLETSKLKNAFESLKQVPLNRVQVYIPPLLSLYQILQEFYNAVWNMIGKISNFSNQMNHTRLAWNNWTLTVEANELISEKGVSFLEWNSKKIKMMQCNP